MTAESVMVKPDYQGIVDAAKADGVPLSKVFAKVVVDGNGVTHASYPIVQPVDGHIAMNGTEVKYDETRVASAKKFAANFHDQVALKGLTQTDGKVATAKVVGSEHALDSKATAHAAGTF
jgi:hypothetical protein